MPSVLQVSISPGGVPKHAIPEGFLGPLGIEGDSHDHPKFHGGPTRAILMISFEGIEELKALGFPLFLGALGENITTEGVDRRMWRSGQRWRIGNAVIELTQMRVPCDQLSVYGHGIQRAVYDSQVKAGDFTSPRWGLSGFYASIVTPAVIHAGDPIALMSEVV
jgi:MOSC domain-containing protein YiiM